VQEREGPAALAADPVVVVRSAEPKQGLKEMFLACVYSGLARSGVGAEAGEPVVSAIPAFAQAGLSMVDSVDTAAGRHGLALLLGGVEPGNYGLHAQAGNGILPPYSVAAVQVSDRLSVLVAARDEEGRIGATVTTLRAHFPIR